VIFLHMPVPKFAQISAGVFRLSLAQMWQYDDGSLFEYIFGFLRLFLKPPDVGVPGILPLARGVTTPCGVLGDRALPRAL